MGGEVVRSESGSAPLLGEPLGVEFANTVYAVRGDVREGMGTFEQLSGWLCDHADQFDDGLGTAAAAQVGPEDLAAFVLLRDTIRSIGRLVTAGKAQNAPVDGAPVDGAPVDGAPVERLVADLNAAAAAAPCWPELRWSPRGIVKGTDAPAVPAALAAIARSAIEIFGAPDTVPLRACGGPGCVLFFVKDHPRREWCCSACGNRARASRYYDRHRATR